MHNNNIMCVGGTLSFNLTLQKGRSLLGMYCCPLQEKGQVFSQQELCQLSHDQYGHDTTWSK